MTGKSHDKPLIRETRGTGNAGWFSLFLHNDEVNSFDYVIESLVEVCHHSGLQAEQCAMIAHYKGQSEVKNGTFEELQIMHSGLAAKGLTSTIE